MSGFRYKQLPTKPEIEEKVTTKPTKARIDGGIQKATVSLSLILLYFSLSIGLTFYQRWLLKDFHYPLTVVQYHLVVKWLLSVVVRALLRLVTGIPQLYLPFMTCLRSVGPTGFASGIDVGFSNWGLELVTISLYTMTKSTTIIFILGFAIVLGLEKKSWSLVGIVLMISAGLIMFTYKATQFNLMGFNFLLLASLAGGLRWTFAQLLMQRSKLGLHNPIDMVFHVQPLMFLSLLPFMLGFEGMDCFKYLQSLSPAEFAPTLLKISVGATIAFAMELSEFLVVTYTSSLTLSVAGIFKEMCILVLAVKVGGDQLSAVNVVGLALCLLGITGHIAHKLVVIRRASAAARAASAWSLDELDAAPETGSPRAVGARADNRAPLLLGEGRAGAVDSDSDVDSNLVLYEVLQRRDTVR